MSFWKRMKEAYRNYVIRMEKANKEVLGDGRPDCCKLNRSQTNGIRR